MVLRVATLNVEQDHKCWEARRHLIAAQLKELNPDFFALNELHIPSGTGRWLQQAAAGGGGEKYSLLQQSKAGDESSLQGEGLLMRHPVIESANLDYHSHNCVALVARFDISGRLLDIYVTHLIAVRVGEEAREEQVSRLLEWIRSRRDADFSIVCGDFNAAPGQPSIRLMSEVFNPTQTKPTAFTPLREPDGKPTHPEWERFDRCIDYIWVSPGVRVETTGLCFDRPARDNPDLWPSDHVGVWADLEIT